MVEVHAQSQTKSFQLVQEKNGDQRQMVPHSVVFMCPICLRSKTQCFDIFIHREMAIIFKQLKY